MERSDKEINAVIVLLLVLIIIFWCVIFGNKMQDRSC